MGRLADARKRARRDGSATPPEPAEHAPAAEAAPFDAERAEPSAATPAADGVSPMPEEAPAAPATGAGEPADFGVKAAPAEPVAAASAETAPLGEPDWSADTLVFPAEDERPQARYVLPSSGLAEEILAAADSRTTALEAAPAPPAPSAPAAAARAHQFTFFATPEREAHEEVEATEHLVTFVVGEEEYGVDVRLVQEIIRVPAVTAVPRAPSFVRGVINLRGRIIPVIDLKTKLGLGRVDAAQRRARVLVVRLKGRLVGLLVDAASQVLKVPVSLIEAAPEEVVEIESHFLRGVAKLDGRLIILVDLLEVLAPELRAEGLA